MTSKRSLTLTLLVLLGTVVMGSDSATMGQDSPKYQYYTKTPKKKSNEASRSKKKFVDLRQFMVNPQDTQQQPADQPGNGQARDRQPESRQPETRQPQKKRPVADTQPRSFRPLQPSTNYSYSRSGGLSPGISPGVMSRATSRNNFNMQFASSAAYTSALSPTLHTVTWRSPNFSHRPLYFQETNLERYGIHKGRMQPIHSGARFFGNRCIYAIPAGFQTSQYLRVCHGLLSARKLQSSAQTESLP